MNRRLSPWVTIPLGLLLGLVIVVGCFLAAVYGQGKKDDRPNIRAVAPPSTTAPLKPTPEQVQAAAQAACAVELEAVLKKHGFSLRVVPGSVSAADDVWVVKPQIILVPVKQ